ncbi:hypothetical protein BCR41DRAFT_357330 [Lobosporangium transversale]|uniref:Uncharacterized protein n=1 Tax=Lobosporangium transversale TaxID=64571 RepID=A0A1Y2GIV9_9FUNG|nr:hypothetical protein BCR41DRAFT_357330 [Lobosporangium transversale]ORZ11004.1 hypothetical protein BCR41DRAFT_357330 [Lobosporangium transversale]|eukprot:XP_021879521.1 hypothetical protein BCR41DRAFT_357330 [Lobosporangium transversale]
MTVIHASQDLYSASNGQSHTLDHIPVNKHFKRTQPVAFAQEKFQHLTLYTGNTIRTGTTGQLNVSLKKSNQELVSAVEESLFSSLVSARINGTTLQLQTPPLLAHWTVIDPSTTSQNLQTALGASSHVIDHFILAIPNQTFDENGLDEADLEAFTNDVEQLYLPIWKRLSELRTGGQIGRLGQLEAFKTVALNNGAAAPEIDQVNLDDCCVLPKDLIEYAKAEGSNLDPRLSTLSSLLRPHLPVTSDSTLTPNFVLKYSALLSGRGLLVRKGYIVNAIAV